MDKLFKFGDLVEIKGLPFYSGAYGHIKEEADGDERYVVQMVGPVKIDLAVHAKNLELVYRVEGRP